MEPCLSTITLFSLSAHLKVHIFPYWFQHKSEMEQNVAGTLLHRRFRQLERRWWERELREGRRSPSRPQVSTPPEQFLQFKNSKPHNRGIFINFTIKIFISKNQCFFCTSKITFGLDTVQKRPQLSKIILDVENCPK